MGDRIHVKLLSTAAQPPKRGSARAAGYDLFAAEEASIPGCRSSPDGRVTVGSALVPTGIAVAIPPGLYGRIAPRSGLAVRHGIDVGAGVIDGDYRDEIRLLLFNFSPEAYHILPGDRVAQIVFERIAEPDVVVVEELDGASRGGGFGSTGLR